MAIEYRWADGQIRSTCRRWRPIWFAARSAVIVAAGAPAAAALPPRRRPRPFRSSSRSAAIRSAVGSCRQPQPAGRQRHRRDLLRPMSLAPKRLELLRELVPAAQRVAVLVNPTNAPDADAELRDVQEAARAIGQQIAVVQRQHASEIDAAFATLVAASGRRAAGQSPIRSSTAGAMQLVALAARHALPAIYRVPRVCRSRRPDELRGQLHRCLSPSRHLRRPHSQGREAGRPAGACSRPSSSWSSTSRPPRRSASTVPPTLLARADEVIE